VRITQAQVRPKRGFADIDLHGVSMRIRVQEAADLPGLVAFLRERSYVADEIGPNTIEVSRLSSVRHSRVRVELDMHLRDWHEAHPEAKAEFVE
jgi:hypothetical protein